MRFSSPEQSKGDSIRRQIETRDRWLALHSHIVLDTSLNMTDAGRSAFNRDDAKFATYALGRFVELVKAGRIARGSYLLLENLDRLSREHAGTALRLLLDLLESGVVVVQLMPATVEFRWPVEMMQLMMAVVELSRGHSESKAKSERGRSVWAEKRRRAREEHTVLTGMLPAWIERRDDKLVLSPQKADAVRRVFDLCASGYGVVSIIKKLIAEKVPAFAAHELHEREETNPANGKKSTIRNRRAVKGQRFGSGHWTRSYISMLLNDRRTLGEFRPGRKNGAPDREPIKGYFPAVVTEEQWLEARAGLSQRSQERFRGRKPAGFINVFAGLLKSARDGEGYFATTRTNHKRLKVGRVTTRHRALINTASGDGRAPVYSFPFDVFERAMLSQLREIDARELTANGRPDEVTVIQGKLGGVEAELSEATAYMGAKGFSPTIGEHITALESRQRELAEQLLQARQRAAMPVDDSWTEARGLMVSIDAARDPEEVRLRLRQLLRRCVESIHLVVASNGLDRLCLAQVRFVPGLAALYRDYIIIARPPLSNGTKSVPARVHVASAANWGGHGDLRDATDVENAITFLESYPKDLINKFLGDK